MKRSILIADDEPTARAYLARLLDAFEDVELVGQMKNGQEVLDFCKTLEPDLLLLDIEMPGIDGMTAARKLSGKLKSSAIIFITAYDQYAIQAFEEAAVGYLLKPFAAKDLRQVLDRAMGELETREKAHFSDRMNALWKQMERASSAHLQSFEIKEKGLITTIKVEEVVYIESASEYAQLQTATKSYLQRLSIKVLADQLPFNFRRIHRSYILNEQHIASWKYQRGKFVFTMTNGQVLSSSRSYKKEINEWLS